MERGKLNYLIDLVHGTMEIKSKICPTWKDQVYIQGP